MAGHLEIEAVLQQGLELRPQQPALGQHGPPLLFDAEEVGLEGGIGDDQGLPQEGAVLGAADGEGVGEPGQVGEGEIAGGGGEGGAQPGAVQEEEQAVVPAEPGEGGELGLGVDHAALGGVGDLHQPGLDQMYVLVPLQKGEQLLRRELAVGAGGERKDLVSGGLHGARLVAVDVGGLGGDDPLPGPQEGGDGGEVGLGAADEELHLGLGALAQVPDQILRPAAVGVVSVAGVALQVGLRQGGEDLGVGAEGVVVAEEVSSHAAALQWQWGGAAEPPVKI